MKIVYHKSGDKKVVPTEKANKLLKTGEYFNTYDVERMKAYKKELEDELKKSKEEEEAKEEPKEKSKEEVKKKNSSKKGRSPARED